MEVPVLNAKSIDAKHGWFTRLGGVSQEPFDSLNVSYNVGDKSEHVTANRSKAITRIGGDPKKLIFAGKLAHGDKVFVASAKDAGTELTGYDAIITNEPDLPIGLSIADCLPIFLESSNPKAVAVVHAGWRGLKAGVIGNTISLMESTYGVDPSHIAAAIGPAIGPKSYEVGLEVADAFPTGVSNRRGTNAYLDMWKVAEEQLKEAGVMNIENVEIDTFRDSHFFSYRRDNGTTGRQLAVISL